MWSSESSYRSARASGLPGSGTQHDTTKITRDGEPDLNTTKITRDGRDSPIGDGAGRTSKLNSQKDHGPLPAGVSARHGSRAEWPGTGVLDLTLVLRTRTGALEVKGETFTRLTPNFSVKVTFTVLLKRSDRTDTARNDERRQTGVTCSLSARSPPRRCSSRRWPFSTASATRASAAPT